jgi:hypothetical protein
MKTKRWWLATVALAAFILLPATAKADPILLFNLVDVQSGVPGQTLTFQGLLTNAGSMPLFINGFSFSLPGGLALDDSLFFTLPEMLTAGQSIAQGVFSVLIGTLTPLGDYLGSFTILGGASNISTSRLATQDFRVSVIPEPATLLLLGTALTGALAMRRRRRRQVKFKAAPSKAGGSSQ